MSTLTLVCIAVNRYMAIVHPHKPLMTTATAIKLVSASSCRNASECAQTVRVSAQHSRKFSVVAKKNPRECINFPLPQVLLPIPRSIQFFSFSAACLTSCNRPSHLLLLFPFLGGEEEKPHNKALAFLKMGRRQDGEGGEEKAPVMETKLKAGKDAVGAVPQIPRDSMSLQQENIRRALLEFNFQSVPSRPLCATKKNHTYYTASAMWIFLLTRYLLQGTGGLKLKKGGRLKGLSFCREDHARQKANLPKDHDVQKYNAHVRVF